jgi:orotate phosphoribosyltransferase
VECCLAIFSYGLEESAAKFRDADIRLFPLLTYDVLLGRAIAKGAIRSDDLALLREWREDPFNWGERHGFPPVKKK